MYKIKIILLTKREKKCHLLHKTKEYKRELIEEADFPPQKKNKNKQRFHLLNGRFKKNEKDQVPSNPSYSIQSHSIVSPLNHHHIVFLLKKGVFSLIFFSEKYFLHIFFG